MYNGESFSKLHIRLLVDFRLLQTLLTMHSFPMQYLPSCFAEKNLSGVSGFIKLQSADGKQWPVRCLYRGGRAKLSQGWYEFTVENNLLEGDVCVFELLKTKEIVLKVNVFRVQEEDAGYGNQPSGQNIIQAIPLRN